MRCFLIKFLKFDTSIICFVLVMAAAIPVAALRAKTYSVGYDLGKLKENERQLRQRNIELQYDLAATERQVREKNLKPGTGEDGELKLPDPTAVLRNQSQTKTRE